MSSEIKVDTGNIEFKNVSFKYEKEKKINTLNSVKYKNVRWKNDFNCWS